MKRTLRAVLFVLLLMVGRPYVLAQTQGALNGVFTINDSGDKVRFSQGNLQYQASTSTWRFASHQYDYVGTDNENISATYSGWIDLFGWGTSGYHNDNDNFNIHYQPYSWEYSSSNPVNADYNRYGYGPSTNMQDPNLTATSAEYDWGVHNAISNGGNQVGTWRVLTIDEWFYVFQTRTASTVGGTPNARFVMSKVNGVKGIILFPDIYNHPSDLPIPSHINTPVVQALHSNSYSGEGWAVMENLGCVFLPSAGVREGRAYFNVRSNYWSTSYYDYGNAYGVGFYYFGGELNIGKRSTRCSGLSVRLVCDFGASTYTIGITTNPTTGGSVTGSGSYAEGAVCTVTATANNGYLFSNWTENGTVVSTDANFSFTVTGDRNLVANFELCSYSITVLANPEMGGMVTGSGSYLYGNSCTLTATANEGYTFINWTKGPNVVSTDATYSFPVTESGEYVANFELINYEITTEANPIEGGFVTGGGTYAYGSTCTISAVANEDYVFSNWTENGAVVSTNATYSFIVSLNRDLVANFSYIGSGGLLDGMFSISNGKKVCFSQGNLQYQASTDTWRFADNQWDWIGGTVQGVHYGNVGNSSNSNISSAYDGWIDLFGWGTSGWDNGNTCYHPWDINSDNDGTLFGPPELNSLVGDNANADWGVYNPISNGGNQANQWRTLTYWEWNYLLNTRTTSSGVRYAKAQLNGVNGLILVPDNWDTSVYELQNVNTSESSYDSNVIGLTVWINTFESNGAVFLPAAGARIYGTTMFYLNDRGYYWSSTCHGNLDNYAIDWGFSDEWLNYFAGNRSTGMSVRLVRDVVTQTVALSEGWNWISLYVELGDPVEALRMFEAALGDNATVISASEMYTEYYGNDIWIGDLDDEGITNEQMYMVEVVNDCEIELEGVVANPADHAITIYPGWNWIGFPSSEELSLEDALADFEAEEGDQLTEAELYTEYGFGMWIGDVAMLVPGQGYMYYSNSTQLKTLVFPSTSKGKNVFLRKRK